MIKISITTRTIEIVAKWMILTELKKENERDKTSEWSELPANGQNYQRKNYQEEIYQRMVVRNSSLMWVQLERCREICVVAD